MAKRANLTPERIVTSAIELLDREGHTKFSMRKLAGLFGVDPMAIYHHIPNRAALMYQVVDRVIGECELPTGDGPWRETAKAICSAFRAMAHRHPGVIQVFDTFDDWVPGEHRIAEALYATLKTGGFSDVDIVKAARLLLAYTENFCAWELTDWIAPYTPEMRSELSDSLAQGEFPLTMTLLEEITHVEPDAEFAFGLDVIVRGLESANTRMNG